MANPNQKDPQHRRFIRFWIEAGDLPYTEKIEGNTLTVVFGDLKMGVKMHPLS